MAVEDTPIQDTSNTQVEDTPIQETNSSDQTSAQLQNYFAAQAAFMDSYNTGANTYEAYKKYVSSSNPKLEAEQQAAKKAQVDSQEVLNTFVTNPGNSEEDIKNKANFVAAAQHEAQKQGSDLDKQYAESIAGPNIDMQKIKDEAARSKMAKMIMKWDSKVSTTDKVMDVAKAFIPGRHTWQGYKLSGSLFNQDEDIKNAMRAFQTESPEDQAKMLPELKRELDKRVGEVSANSIIHHFFTAGGADTFNKYSNTSEALDALALGGTAAQAVGALKAFKDGFNVVKSMASVGNKEGAVDAATASLIDKDVAAAANVDELTRVSNAMPYDTTIEDLGRQGGLSAGVRDNLEKFYNKADATAKDIIAGKSYLKEGILNTTERRKKEAEAIKKFQADRAENVRIAKRDENTTTFIYDSVDADGNTITNSSTLDLTLNDVGTFGQSTMGKIRRFIGSSTAFSKAALKEDVATAQRVDYLKAKMNTQLNQLTKEAIQPLGSTLNLKTRGRLAKIDHALQEGDEFKNADGTRGKVFKPEELKRDYGLDDTESGVYYRINRLYNNLFNIRNHEKRQEMIALGFKSVNLPLSDENTYGKLLDNAGAAQFSLGTNNTNFVYDAANDALVNVKKAGTDFLKKEYENGKRLVRLDEPYNIGGERGSVFYILSHEGDITDLPDVVLYRKEGYVPRIHENGAFFVKEHKERLVDGDKTVPYTTTLRFFDNKPEAEMYKEQLVQKELAQASEEGKALSVKYEEQYSKYLNGMKRYEAGLRKTKPKEPKKPDIPSSLKKVEEDARRRYQVHPDREEQKLGQHGGVGHGSGGLYTGARAEEAILYGLNGDKAERVNSFESLTRNNANVARYASVNQWRLGLEQRWINTANEILREKGYTPNITEFTRLDASKGATEEVKFLNRVFDQIRDWQNFPTQEEQIYNSLVQSLYDVTKGAELRKEEGIGKAFLGNSAKLLGNFRNRDPIAAARSASFHSLLGFFNISQFWVQAQGFANAFALGFGKYFTRVSLNTLGLTSLGWGEVNDARIALAAKAAHIDTSEMKALYNLWKKTGYQDSVLQTADYAAASKGYGLTKDIIKRLANAGLIPYKHGEMFNRRMSFTTAVERFKEKEGLPSIANISDDQLKRIIDDTNNIMMNLSRANRATWQKGILSLPTQYMQVTTKFVETALGLNGHFTGWERAKLVGAQLVLYGLAGVPLVGLGEKYATQVLGMTQQDIENHPKLFAAINDGFWGVTSFWALGMDFDISSRGSLLRGVSQFIDNWFLEDSNVASEFLGAFGSTASRSLKGLSHGLAPFTLGQFNNIDLSDVANLVINPTLGAISSWRNYEKAQFMNRVGLIKNSKGQPVLRQNFTARQAIMQAIGFTPSVIGEDWQLHKLVQDDNATKKRIISELLNTMDDWAYNHPDGNYTQEELDHYNKRMALYYQALDPAEQLEAQRAVWRAATGKDQHHKNIEQAIKYQKQNTAADMDATRSFLIGNKFIRLGIDTGENQ